MYIYGSYRKNKIGVPFFGPPYRPATFGWFGQIELSSVQRHYFTKRRNGKLWRLRRNISVFNRLNNNNSHTVSDINFFGSGGWLLRNHGPAAAHLRGPLSTFLVFGAIKSPRHADRRWRRRVEMADTGVLIDTRFNHQYSDDRASESVADRRLDGCRRWDATIVPWQNLRQPMELTHSAFVCDIER